MHVPADDVEYRAEMVHRAHPHAALDQTPRQQARLAKRVAPVTIADFPLLLRQVERSFCFRRKNETEGPVVARILRTKIGGLSLDAPLPAIHFLKQVSPGYCGRVAQSRKPRHTPD